MPSIDSNILCLHTFNMPHTATKKTVYGQRIQFADSQDDTKEIFLSASAKTLIQQIIGIFLYYGIALDLTMLVALGTLATQQSKPTESLWNDITWFLNYAASHPDANFLFSASDIILHIASD